MGRKKSKTERALVAHAGKDQVVYARYNGVANVTLDGSSGSRSKRLTYTWYLDGSPIAMGIRPTVKLISGEHTVALVLNNGRIDSEPSHVVITVVDPMEVECRIFPPSKDLFKKTPEIMARLYLPPGMTTDHVNSDQPLCIYPGGTEVIDQYAIQWRRNRMPCANVFAFFSKDVLTHVAPDGSVELTVSGQLKTGQYFFGKDTIRVADMDRIALSKRKTIRT